METKKVIYEYLDYRRFLEDSFLLIRARNPRFSYRAFARMAGLKSPNLLQMVVTGERRLPATAIPTLCAALHLTAPETAFFHDLVEFAHARDSSERDEQYRKILRSAKFKEARPLVKEEYECFRRWWVPVVRELATHPDGKGSAEWIVNQIIPKVTLVQVEQALEILIALNLLSRKDSSGRYYQTDSVVKTPSEVDSTAVAGYHREVIALATNSIDTIAPQDRDIRSATLGVSKSTARLLKKRLDEFWTELLEQAGRESVPEVVLQYNTQLFPLAQVNRKAAP